MPGDEAFVPGETVTFEGTGGVDFQAFSLSVVAPEPLAITASAVKAGEPLTVTWTPPAPPTSVTLTGPALSVFCTPSRQGEVVIPGTLTALFGTTAGLVFVGAARRVSAGTDFGGASPDVFGYAISHDTLQVSYTP